MLSISPQFHVVFDNWFTTVISSPCDDTIPEWWPAQFQSCFLYNFDGEGLTTLDGEWLDNKELALKRALKKEQHVLPPPPNSFHKRAPTTQPPMPTTHSTPQIANPQSEGVADNNVKSPTRS